MRIRALPSFGEAEYSAARPFSNAQAR